MDSVVFKPARITKSIIISKKRVHVQIQEKSGERHWWTFTIEAVCCSDEPEGTPRDAVLVVVAVANSVEIR